MLPWLSRLSVRVGPAGRLRHRCSARYQRISPLLRAFRQPLPPSSPAVWAALPQVSRGLSQPTRGAAYALFTPSNSGQRSHPTYYRGCWHVVSRCLFPGYRPSSPPGKAVYTPKGSVLHAASLGQAFAHCQNSLTAASRRSLGRVSVPVWLAVLSDQLRITALVGRYPTN